MNVVFPQSISPLSVLHRQKFAPSHAAVIKPHYGRRFNPLEYDYGSAARGLFVALAIVLAMPGCREKPSSPANEPVSTIRYSLRNAPPAPRPKNYAGSESCRECHEKICDLYATHPMGRSMGSISSVETIEQYPSGPIHTAGQRGYRVERTDDTVWHHEFRVDSTGEVVYDQRETVKYAVGSGQRGRAYLIESNGVLRQSPIGWYSTEDVWDLSPGYAVDSHPRFQRRIGDGCLYCHAGQVDSIGHDRYAEPAFVEAAISCERCHGPASQHVEFHRNAEKQGDIQDNIVNPAKLDIAARESVCNQCHLQGLYTIPRYGRSFHDFRPGDRMEDILICLVSPDANTDGQPSRVVSQVEQMRQSKCYIESQAELGCTSCHDPHSPAPAANRDVYYQDRCNVCHHDRQCLLPPAEQQLAPAFGSCIACHMPADEQTNVPHTAQTDHRILRNPKVDNLSKRSPRDVQAASPMSLDIFDDSPRIPDWEKTRAIGIAMMTEAWAKNDIYLARQAIVKLVPQETVMAGGEAMIAALTPDLPALNELACYFWLSDKVDDAQLCWLHVLDLQPQDETALAGLVLASQRSEKPAIAEKYLDRLLAITPDDPQWLTQKVKLAWQQGRQDEAFGIAERLLVIDPTLNEFRKWLANAYRQTRQIDKARSHDTILNRLGL